MKKKEKNDCVKENVRMCQHEKIEKEIENEEWERDRKWRMRKRKRQIDWDTVNIARLKKRYRDRKTDTLRGKDKKRKSEIHLWRIKAARKRDKLWR